MKPFKLIIIAAAIAFTGTGCTMVSYNRVFPKLTWYWSQEAREQRADRLQEKQWEASLPTNSPAR